MKKTMKKCLTLLLALAMLLAMAVPAAAEEPNYSRTITFTDVAQGDTVKAYKLVGYNATYTEYEFHGDFNNFVGQYYNTSGTLSTEDYLKDLDSTHMAALLAGYVNMCQIPGAAGNHALPTESATATADASNQVTLTLEPGYYVVLGSTTATNDRTYQLTSVFVQVKNGELKVIAGDGKTEIIDGEVQLKHTTGPIISMSVKDDKGTPAAWKGAAAGQVGEVLDFYIHLKLPDYNNDNVYMTKLALNNTLKGLQYVENSATVYKTTADGTANVENALIEVVPVTGANGQQTVTFKLKYNTGNSGSAINLRNDDGSVGVYIRYKAEVQPAAAEKGVNATDSAVLRYATSLESTKVKTAEAAANTVYTYAFSLAKHSDTLVDKNDTTKGHEPLSNAAFSVYDKDKNAAIQMVKETPAAGEVYYRPAAAGETGTVTELPANQGAGKNTLLVRGLDVKEYTVAEVKTPSGFYAPKGDFKVVLEGERDAAMGTLSENLKNTSTFTHKADADKDLINGAAVLHDGDLSRLDASLKNSSSPVLPTTGGVGTVMFTVIGLLCMGAALWFFLFARRRREDEQEQNKTTL